MEEPEEARKVLEEGYEENPKSEALVLALQKINREIKNYKEA